MLAISAVSASDNTTNDIVGIDDTNTNNTLTVDSTKTFTDLNKTINSNTNPTIELNDDYKYYNETDEGFENGITINRDVTIDGNGHNIDGNKKVRIFKIADGCTVIFKNINFINGFAQETNSMGGAIYGICTAENCNFINNSAKQGGGAMYMSTAKNCNFINNYAKNGQDGFGGAIANGKAENCNFINNSADFGGALFQSTAKNCIFTNNYATSHGGAISEGEATNCKFINNSAEKEGGATYSSNIKSSSFIHNYALKNGGAMSYGTATQCTFTDNSAYNGGAIYGGSDKAGTIADHCTFTGNYAVNHGGAMYYSTGKYCTFKDNTAKSGADTYNCILTKLKTTIYISPSKTVYYSDNIVVTLKNTNGKVVSGVKVTFYANGKKIATKITNKYGQIKITSGYFGIKTYTIKASFAGDANYYSSAKTTKITVKKGIPKITATAKTFKRSTKTKSFSMTLKTHAGKIMKYKKVTLKVNGKYYYAKTNSKGIAIFKITKLHYRGKYTAAIRYSGSSYYNAVTKKVAITVK